MAERKLANALKRRVDELPEHPGVYLFKDSEKRPIYIGKALSIRKRVLSHFRSLGDGFSKIGKMLEDARTVRHFEVEEACSLRQCQAHPGHLVVFVADTRADRAIQMFGHSSSLRV